MRAGDIAHGINHRQHDEAEGECNTDVRHGAGKSRVDSDRACPREAEGEGADKFSRVTSQFENRPIFSETKSADK